MRLPVSEGVRSLPGGTEALAVQPNRRAGSHERRIGCSDVESGRSALAGHLSQTGRQDSFAVRVGGLSLPPLAQAVFAV